MPQIMVEIFKALADGTRQDILQMLRSQDLCVTEICEAFEMSQPTISHHLQILKRSGLVNTEKKGKMIYYRIESVRFNECYEEFLVHFIRG